MSISSVEIISTKVLKSNFSIVGFEKLYTQLVNIIFFFFVSREISKEGLGTYNWILATITVGAAVLSLGIENVIIRRVATIPEDASKIGNTFTTYLSLVGIFSIVTLFIVYLLEVFDKQLVYYLLLGAVQALLSYYIMIYRGIALGNEQFLVSAKASIINISGKVLVGFLILLIHKSVEGLMWGLISGNLICVLYYRFNNLVGSLRFNFDKNTFLDIIKESSPLIGVIIFNSALSRFDWIFLGMYSNMSQTGEYTFAYRIYEMSWLPHAIISMVLLPKISRMCKNINDYKLNSNQIKNGIIITILASVVLPTIICIIWTPLIDLLTDGKYGAVNQSTIELLSLTVPFMASIGMLWNLSMALKLTKSILTITVTVSLINIVLNIFLIKKLDAHGAAIANLSTGIIQFVLYYISLYKYDKAFVNVIYIVFGITIIASLIYCIILLMPLSWVSKLIITSLLYSFVFTLLIKNNKQYLILFKNA